LHTCVAPNPSGPFELAVVDVDADDGRRTGEPCPGDRCVADAAATEHGHRLAAGDAGGVEGGSDARHHAAAEQARGGGGRGGVDLRALTGGDERLVAEGADAEGR
jgi:hypothetical protein